LEPRAWLPNQHRIHNQLHRLRSHGVGFTVPVGLGVEINKATLPIVSSGSNYWHYMGNWNITGGSFVVDNKRPKKVVWEGNPFADNIWLTTAHRSPASLSQGTWALMLAGLALMGWSVKKRRDAVARN